MGIIILLLGEILVLELYYGKKYSGTDSNPSPRVLWEEVMSLSQSTLGERYRVKIITWYNCVDDKMMHESDHQNLYRTMMED